LQAAGFADVWARRQLTMVLDGLDEASTQKELITKWLGRLVRNEPHHHVFLTTRPSGYSQTLSDLGFIDLRLQPLNSSQLRALCLRRLDFLNIERHKAIIQEIALPQFQRLTSSPMVATLALRCVAVPELSVSLCRCHVYEIACKHFLQSVRALRLCGIAEYEQLVSLGALDAAKEVAHVMQGLSCTMISEHELFNHVPFARVEAVKLLMFLGSKGKLAIVEVSGSGLRFVHLCFQEFLAAKHIWDSIDTGADFPAWLDAEENSFAAGCSCMLGVIATRRKCFPLPRFSELSVGLGGALRHASRAGDEEAVSGLLGLAPDPVPLLASVWKTGGTALHLAAKSGHLGVCRTLLAAGAASARAGGAAAALSAAAAQRDGTELVRVLLCAAASPNVKKGEVPLVNAVRVGNVEVVHQLLMARADTSSTYGFDTALIAAARNGDAEMTRTLLRANSPVQRADRDGFTALISAARAGHDEVVDELLVARADVHGANAGGYTALIDAARRGHSEVVAALLDSRARVNDRNVFGSTALTMASAEGQLEVVMALLVAGADIFDTSCDGQTALSAAIRAGHSQVAAVLQAEATRC